MEILQPIRNNFLVVGVVPFQKCPLNFQNLRTFFSLFMGALLNCVHLFHEAESFKEYADSFCTTSIMTVATMLFSIMIWKTRTLFHLLNALEEIVTKRELKIAKCSTCIKLNFFCVGLDCQRSAGIYHGIKENIQKINDCIEFLIIKCFFPFVIFSKFITSYFAYFISNLGSEAFELTFPFWYFWIIYI